MIVVAVTLELWFKQDGNGKLIWTRSFSSQILNSGDKRFGDQYENQVRAAWETNISQTIYIHIVTRLKNVDHAFSSISGYFKKTFAWLHRFYLIMVLLKLGLCFS